MKRIRNIALLGTSHIAQQSIREISDAIETLKPELIAVELDKQRLHALLSGERRAPGIQHIPRIGFKGWLFALLGGWASQKLGKIVGVEPGTEMKTAIELGKKNNMRIALIDQPIEITLKRFSKALTWKERGRMVADLVRGPTGKKISIDLKKVPEAELVSTLLKELKTRYPNIYTVLIDERNVYMTEKLKALTKLYPEATILVIVGAGHVEGITQLLG